MFFTIVFSFQKEFFIICSLALLFKYFNLAYASDVEKRKVEKRGEEGSNFFSKLFSCFFKTLGNGFYHGTFIWKGVIHQSSLALFSHTFIFDNWSQAMNKGKDTFNFITFDASKLLLWWTIQLFSSNYFSYSFLGMGKWFLPCYSRFDKSVKGVH